MPTWGEYSGLGRRWWYRSPVKRFRGTTFLDALAGEKRRRWRVVDRYFDRAERLYVHEVVPA